MGEGGGGRDWGLEIESKQVAFCQRGVRQGGDAGQAGGGGGQVVGRLSLCPVPASSLCQALPSPTHHMGVSLDSRSGQELQELRISLSAMRTSHRVPECECGHGCVSEGREQDKGGHREEEQLLQG